MKLLLIALLCAISYAQTESGIYPRAKELKGRLELRLVEYEDGTSIEDGYVLEDQKGFLWTVDFENLDSKKYSLKDHVGEKVILQGMQTDKWFVDVHHIELDESAVGSDENWRAQKCTGTKTMLIVEVSTLLDDFEISHSLDDIKKSVFGMSFTNQTNFLLNACSNGKLQLIPWVGDVNGRHYDGATTVDIDMEGKCVDELTSLDRSERDNKVWDKLFGDAGDDVVMPDYVAFALEHKACSKWGSYTLAYGIVGGYKTWYYHSAWTDFSYLMDSGTVMHELGHNFGFSHSARNGNAYGGAKNMGGGSMFCFNGHKSWGTEWYKDHHANWNPSQGAQTFQMIGVGDYKNAQESDTVIIRISSQTGTYYIDFSAAVGINEGKTGGVADTVTIVWATGMGQTSQFVAQLNEGSEYQLENVRVRVQSISDEGLRRVALVDIIPECTCTCEGSSQEACLAESGCEWKCLEDALSANYIGCYSDDPQRSFDISKGRRYWSLEACSNECDNEGYSHFALQDPEQDSGPECWCGNGCSGENPLAYPQVDDEECLSLWGYFGGENRNAVYHIGARVDVNCVLGPDLDYSTCSVRGQLLIQTIASPTIGCGTCAAELHICQGLDAEYVHYMLGELGGLCESDNLMITTEVECRSAMEALGMTVVPDTSWTDGNYDAVPGGCSVKLETRMLLLNSGMHFNTGLTSADCCSGRSDLAPICKAESGYSEGPGLYETKFSGYHDEDVSFFDDIDRITSSSKALSISKGDEGTYYSYRWSGYFCPPITGLYRFRTNSNDGSYMYVNREFLVDNGGSHSMRIVESDYMVESTECVVVEIFYGETWGGAGMEFSFQTPTNETWAMDYSDIFFLEDSNQACLLGPVLNPDDCTRCGEIFEQEVIAPHIGNGPCSPEVHICSHLEGECVEDRDCVLGDSLDASSCSVCGTLEQVIIEPSYGSGICSPQTFICKIGDGACVCAPTYEVLLSESEQRCGKSFLTNGWKNLGSQSSTEDCANACINAHIECSYAVYNHKNGACTAFTDCSPFDLKPGTTFTSMEVKGCNQAEVQSTKSSNSLLQSWTTYDFKTSTMLYVFALIGLFGTFHWISNWSKPYTILNTQDEEEEV